MAQVYGGAKLGTRIATLVSNAIIYTHNRLHSAKHKLAMAVFHSISDVISEEVHRTLDPVVGDLHERYDPNGALKPLLKFMHHETGQLQALVGTSVLSQGLLWPISALINNELAPVVYEGVSSNPHSIPDAGTISQLGAKGLIDEASFYDGMAKNGFNHAWAAAMKSVNLQYPDVGSLLTLMRRGFVDRAQFIDFATRSGMDNESAQLLSNLVSVPISPADAALALLRGNMSRAQALEVAHGEGMSESDFDVLVNNTGEPPGIMQMLEAFRRDFIDEATLTKGILQSRVRDEWIPMLLKLRYTPMTVADAVNANIQGHISEDEGKSIADQNGLEPGAFDILIQTAGEPLSRTEMEQLYNRGKVTAAEVRQALLESRLKNKYTEYAFDLHEKLLPIRNLSEAVEFGTLSLADAVTEAMKNGYSQRDATALIQAASARKLHQYRQNVVTAVEALYVDNAISEDSAMQVATGMGFDTVEAQAVFAGAEYKRKAKMIASAVSAIRSKYISRHIDKSVALGLLDAIGIPATNRDQELQLWEIERNANVRLLTPAEVAKAVKNGDITQQDGLDYLMNLGYSQADATLRLVL